MARYRCQICGFIYDEEKEGKPFSELEVCPMCKQPASNFVPVEEEVEDAVDELVERLEAALAYDPSTARRDTGERFMDEIHDMAVSGTSIHAAMSTKRAMPGWDDIYILGAQLGRLPLLDDEKVIMRTVIGSSAKKPLRIDGPVYVSHMSFGALSREAKVALAKGSAAAGTATCSGEGGILPDERDAAKKYIFEYVPNRYGDTDENLRAADAIEIKIGQGTKPGMGGHLPGDKVTPEIAELRGKKVGQDVQSPSRFPDIASTQDLRDLVDSLRERSGGRPIGIKIAAGRIEADLAQVVAAGADFVTIDGRGGATGSSPLMLRESTSVPTLFALARARKFLDEAKSEIELVITGGLRTSSDVAKAIALGADAVAMASAPLIAAGCQQYRICGSGGCPVGIATQDPELRKRLDVDVAAARVENFFKVLFAELAMFARITGHKRLSDLSCDDLVTLDDTIEKFVGIRHAGAPVQADVPELEPKKPVGQGGSVRVRCLLCGKVFETPSLEEAVCPVCKAAFPNIVFAD